MTNFSIEVPLVSDSAEICDVLRRSISELCQGDHKGDPTVLAAWLESKTPETIATWLANETQEYRVVRRAGKICAVGGYRRNGSILLNYVAPECQYEGVSTLLLDAMERALATEEGGKVVTLTSTQTAKRFYEARGWKTKGESVDCFGTVGWEMEKALL